MSRWKPCSRRIFIQKLRQLGFEGPYSGEIQYGPEDP